MNDIIGITDLRIGCSVEVSLLLYHTAKLLKDHPEFKIKAWGNTSEYIGIVLDEGSIGRLKMFGDYEEPDYILGFGRSYIKTVKKGLLHKWSLYKEPSIRNIITEVMHGDKLKT